MASLRRIMKELDDMARDSSSGMAAEPVAPADVTHLRGIFAGPPDTPYAGGRYIIDIVLPDNYPFVPPKMKFETKVWHPNVSSQTGAICLDTLAAKWSPVLTIKTALLSLQSLLAAPEPSDPQDAEVAKMMINDRPGFNAKAREWAYRYAGAPPPPPSESANGMHGGGKVVAESAAERAERERATKAALAERRRTLLDGYPEDTVLEFEGMGFEAGQVVHVMKRLGIRRGARVEGDMKAMVVEGLLGFF